jgi:hypothetical protein
MLPLCWLSPGSSGGNAECPQALKTGLHLSIYEFQEFDHATYGFEGRSGGWKPGGTGFQRVG